MNQLPKGAAVQEESRFPRVPPEGGLVGWEGTFFLHKLCWSHSTADRVFAQIQHRPPYTHISHYSLLNLLGVIPKQRVGYKA